MMIPPAMSRRRNQFCLLVFIICSLYWFLHLRTKSLPFEDDIHWEAPPATWPALDSSSVMLVTAYYPDILSHSDTSISNTLHINTPLYIFTTTAALPQIQNLRGNRPTIYDPSLPSPTTIPELFLSVKKFDEQLELDRLAGPEITGPDVYALKTAKPWFLNASLARVERKPGYVIWMDVDAEHGFESWPDKARVSNVTGDGERVFTQLVGLPHPTLRYWTQSAGTISAKFLSSTILGGKASLIPDFAARFYRAHDTLLHMRAFVGTTDVVLSALALSRPDTFSTLALPADTHLPYEGAGQVLPRGCGGKPWAYLLASEEERQRYREKMWWGAWWERKGWFGWKECQIGEGDVGSLRDALQGLFGKWEGARAEWER